MLPKLYSFLDDIQDKPKIVTEALKYIGLREIPGKQNNEVIMNMARDLGIADIYVNDEMSWCALFICWILWKCGKPLPYLEYELVRAGSFAGFGNTKPQAWGEKVSFSKAALGDIVILSRAGGYHIGILIAISKVGLSKRVHLLGGNQGNSVNISEFDSLKIVSIRRYYSIGAPAGARQYVIDSSGRLQDEVA